MVNPSHLTVKCETCNDLVRPETPQYRTWFIIGGMAVLGGAGLLIGLTVGVATAGAGMTAAPFLVVIGLYAGYKTGGLIAEYLDGYSCPGCGEYFKSPSLKAKVMGLIPSTTK